MLSRAAAAAVVLVGVLAPVATADDGPTVGNDDGCRGSMLCASDGGSKPGTGGGSGAGVTPPGTSGRDDSSASKCTYEKADPQPPAENLAWGAKTPDDGAIYRVSCEGGRVGVVFVPNGAAGPAAPTIDPELVARRAVDSMKLLGPAVASPKAGGRYVVGMPMWMWADQSATTYGPTTASATAGGVTVTATAKVSSIAWRWVTAPRSPATVPAPDTTHPRARHRRPTAGTATRPHRPTRTAESTPGLQPRRGPWSGRHLPSETPANSPRLAPPPSQPTSEKYKYSTKRPRG